MAKALGVKNRHPDYVNMAKKWQRCRDVVSGQDAVHSRGTEYLPILFEQELSEYLAMVKRTPFYNATWRTIAGFVGMLFRKPPTLEVPKKLEKLLEDVTMSGVTFQAFAQDCALENLQVSRLGVLVDHPLQIKKEDGSSLSVAEAEAAGMRPSMQMYKAEGIINWEHGRVNNKTVLTQVRLAETVTIKQTEFTSTTENQIKVLDLFNGFYRIRIFKEENEEQVGDDIFPLMNGQMLEEIPFYFIGPDGTEAHVDDPIMIDLVDINLAHYRVSADYEHGCHMTGLPTPVISGYQPGFDETTGAAIKAKFYIGSTTAWVFPDANTKAEFLEFTGQGMDALEKNLGRKEAQMAAIGARMLAPEKTGVEAAHTLAMRHAGENSILAAIAIAVSSGLTKALIMFAKWANEKGECKFEINRDFIPMAVDSGLLGAWLAAVQAGRMSPESHFDLMKRADMIDAELSFEDEQARIDANPPPPPVQLQVAALNGVKPGETKPGEKTPPKPANAA